MHHPKLVLDLAVCMIFEGDRALIQKHSSLLVRIRRHSRDRCTLEVRISWLEAPRDRILEAYKQIDGLCVHLMDLEFDTPSTRNDWTFMFSSCVDHNDSYMPVCHQDRCAFPPVESSATATQKNPKLD